jgi:hypothetical protein
LQINLPTKESVLTVARHVKLIEKAIEAAEVAASKQSDEFVAASEAAKE